MSSPTKKELEVEGEAACLENTVPYVIDPVAEKKVIKKLDRVILPLMASVYFFQCLWPLHLA